MAQKPDIAERLKGMLEGEGLLVRLRATGAGIRNNSFEVLVPETEVSHAHDIIIETGF